MSANSPSRSLCLVLVCMAVMGAMLAVPNIRAADAPQDLKQWLKSFQRRTQEKPSERQSRELTYAALVVLTNGDDPKDADDYLRRAYDTQEMDRSHPAYGQLRWLVGDAGPITDFNSIEFNSIPLGAILNGYGEKLPAECREYLKPHVQASLAALRAHQVSTSYTNICLMNSISLVLLGQAAPDETAVKLGNDRLDAWIAYTRANGIHEFDSPTYYGVDLYSLMKGYRYVADPATKAKLKTILDYFWTDIAANYFAPAQKISGPYARDYDFLAGTGQLDDWLRSAGWAQGAASITNAVVDNFEAKVYQPPADAAKLAQSGSRYVVSSWDDQPGHLRFAWLGKSAALGCTSGRYEPQDKLFTAMLGEQDMPQISIVVDRFDAPYGLVKRPDRTNHFKPFHEDANLGCVQYNGTALVTLDINPSTVLDDGTGLATNFILPAGAAIAVDDKAVDLSTPTQIDVDRTAIVTATAGGGTFALRLLNAETIDGVFPRLLLASDESGLSHHAVRLKLIHLSHGSTSKATHLRVAFLVAVEDTDSTEPMARRLREAQTHEETVADRWCVNAKLSDVTLEVDRSATDSRVVVPPRINGADVPRAVLSVSGVDRATDIWRRLP